MLVLSRTCRRVPDDDAVVVLDLGGGRAVTVTVVEVAGNRVRLGFEADPGVVITRKELLPKKGAGDGGMAAGLA